MTSSIYSNIVVTFCLSHCLKLALASVTYISLWYLCCRFKKTMCSVYLVYLVLIICKSNVYLTYTMFYTLLGNIIFFLGAVYKVISFWLFDCFEHMFWYLYLFHRCIDLRVDCTVNGINTPVIRCFVKRDREYNCVHNKISRKKIKCKNLT